MICIIYVILVGCCCAAIGALSEPLLAPRVPRRAIWLTTILLSVVVPPLFWYRHAVAVPMTHADGSMTWWMRLALLDGYAMRAWSVAQITLLSWAILGLFAAWYRVRKATLARTTVDGLPVTITEGVGPATIGWLRPRIIIPRWVLALSADERRYVLMHEHEHARTRDPLVLFAASLLLVMTPWYLPLWWQMRRLAHAAELDCDDRVVNSLGDPDKYARLLIDVARFPGSGPQLQPGFLGVRGSLERRLEWLLQPRKWTRAQRFVLIGVAVVLLIAVLLTPHPRMLH
jgi:beta-lactamase regulating signal transducer with metallopeptidase domain